MLLNTNTTASAVCPWLGLSAKFNGLIFFIHLYNIIRSKNSPFYKTYAVAISNSIY